MRGQQKAPYVDEASCLNMVPGDRIELPTRGFSIQTCKYIAMLIAIDILNINQQDMSLLLDI
jgi:hypothetical protein